jgi:hypothetical protein
MTGKYKCKICGAEIEDAPDILDEHLFSHSIPLLEMWAEPDSDSEAIYDKYYIRNI